MNRFLLSLLCLLVSAPAAFAQTSPFQGHWTGGKLEWDIRVSGSAVVVSHVTATGRTKSNEGVLREAETAVIRTPQGPITLHVDGGKLTADLPNGKTAILHR